jgi:hypothetical protein
MSFSINRFPTGDATFLRLTRAMQPRWLMLTRASLQANGGFAYRLRYQYWGRKDCWVSAPNPSGSPPTLLETA